MKKVELDIMALSHSATNSNNYAVVLGEVDGSRKLPIVIGGFEAQAIAVAMEDMEPNRPLTHDLFMNALKIFEVAVQEVVINQLIDGIFHALLICEGNGGVYEIDSRTSDAIAMAVRFDCPIYTYEEILAEAGIVMEDEEASHPEPADDDTSAKKPSRRRSAPKTFDTMSDDDLNKSLDAALEKEDYEKAAKIRDEINKRNG